MKRNIERKPHPIGTGTAETVDLTSSSRAEGITAGGGRGLAELVWKHFEDLITETLTEVQESLGAQYTNSSSQIRQ